MSVCKIFLGPLIADSGWCSGPRSVAASRQGEDARPRAVPSYESGLGEAAYGTAAPQGQSDEDCDCQDRYRAGWGSADVRGFVDEGVRARAFLLRGTIWRWGGSN